MKKYIEKNKKAVIVGMIFTFICFGFMLTNFTVSIDEETWILSQKQSVLWLQQGRFGIWLLNLLFTKGGNYAPFLWDVLAIICWNIAGVIFSYSLWQENSIEEWQLGMFLAMYSSIPLVVGEIIAFSMFNFQVCMAMLWVAIAFLYCEKYQVSRKKYQLIIACGFLMAAVAVYQAFIGVYITAVVARQMIKTADETKFSRNDLIKIGTHVFVCITGVIAYAIINRVLLGIVGDPGYLTENYIGWHSGNWKKAVVMAVANIGRVLLAISYKGEYIYGGLVIRSITIAFVLFAIILFFKRKGWKNKLQIFIFSVSLCVAPFTLYLLLATYKTRGRMLLAIPLALGVEFVILLKAVDTKKKMQVLFVVIGCWLLFLNARNMNLLYYYDSVVYTKDCEVAAQLMNRMNEQGIDYKNKPIAFIGMIKQDDLPIKVSGTIGGSFFEWDDGNGTRIRDFLLTRGYKVELADVEKLQKAMEQRAYMNVWPAENSICELDDVIVVYLSEPTGKWHQTNNVPNN